MDQGAALLPPPAAAGQIYSLTAFLALAWRRSCSPVTPLANPGGNQLGEQGTLLGRPNPAPPPQSWSPRSLSGLHAALPRGTELHGAAASPQRLRQAGSHLGWLLPGARYQQR